MVGGTNSGGTSSTGSYCRKTNSWQPTGLFICPADFCTALDSAVTRSDTGSIPGAGAEVRAGRCAAPDESFDAVYFGTAVGETACYYRTGAFAGSVDWGDSSITVNGCTIFRGPVVYGEFPASAIHEYAAGCDGLTTYRKMSYGAAGAPNTAGTAGTAGAPNGPEVGECYQAATATCGPC
jgi:hypothetical protein